MILAVLHETLGLSYRAIGNALGSATGRRAPSAARVSDWVSGTRPTPEWACAAAARVICDRWTAARAGVPASELAAVDRRWSAILDPVLGHLYAALHATDVDGMREALRHTLQTTAENVSKRLGVTIPGDTP